MSRFACLILILLVQCLSLPAHGQRSLFHEPAAAFNSQVELFTAEGAGLLGVQSWKVRFPSAIKTRVRRNNTVHGIYFEPRRPTDRAIVFLPWFKDGDTQKIQWIGSVLAAGGFKVLFIAMGYQFERAPSGRGSGSAIFENNAAHVQQWARQAVSDARRARLWLMREKNVPGNRIGLMGISLGGFITGLTYGVAPEFKAAAMILAGGGLGPLVSLGARLNIPQVNEAIGKLKVEPAQVEALIKPYDPITYADPKRKGGLLMVNGLLDPVVPYPLAHSLWKAYGKPKMLRLPTGHVTSVAMVPIILARTMAHFRRQFK